MMQFNLGRFKSGGIALTRSGRKARYIEFVPSLGKYHQLIVHIEGDTVCTDYSADGVFQPGVMSDLDLECMAPEIETRVGWINCYASHDTAKDTIYSSRKDADDYAVSGRIDCVRIEYEVKNETV